MGATRVCVCVSVRACECVARARVRTHACAGLHLRMKRALEVVRVPLERVRVHGSVYTVVRISMCAWEWEGIRFYTHTHICIDICEDR